MSIIYPTMISLQNVLLKQFEDENISNFDANNTNMMDFLDIFNIEEVSDKDEELEQAEELADITNLTELIKKMMASLFAKYYQASLLVYSIRLSDDDMLFIATSIDPRCKNIKLEDTASDIQDYLRRGFNQETSNNTCKPLSDGIILNMLESFISSVFVAALPRVNRSNEVDQYFMMESIGPLDNPLK
ncbi:6427_t:CDS:2 [Gigaspora margarita]|uniref:6427_t:CDS:1 n=1 Tax=Gigaspora margarita TaxID=4874 RepID=A0ABN7W8U4_GIGMA|nr:6427_t:CDS:2 [Gigaspora margarita]